MFVQVAQQLNFLRQQHSCDALLTRPGTSSEQEKEGKQEQEVSRKSVGYCVPSGHGKSKSNSDSVC